MATVQIEASKRDKTKKRACLSYRKQGLIPSVIYGSKENINILIDKAKFNKLFSKITRSTLIDLTVDSKNHEVIIKDYQKDYLNDNFIHIDFFELQKDKPIHFSIPFNFIGIPAGVREGGILVKQLIKVEVECFSKDVVAQIDVNVEQLNVNDTLHIKDITFDPKYKILSNLQDVIVHVSGKKAEEEEVVKVEAEAGAEVPAAAATEEAAKTEETEKTEKSDKKEKKE